MIVYSFIEYKDQTRLPPVLKKGVGFVGPLASQTSQPTLSIYRTSQNDLSQRTIWYQVIPSYEILLGS